MMVDVLSVYSTTCVHGPDKQLHSVQHRAKLQYRQLVLGWRFCAAQLTVRMSQGQGVHSVDDSRKPSSLHAPLALL